MLSPIPMAVSTFQELLNIAKELINKDNCFNTLHKLANFVNGNVQNSPSRFVSRNSQEKYFCPGQVYIIFTEKILLSFEKCKLHSVYHSIAHIFKTANIGRLTFLLPISRLEIHKRSTKSEGFQCAELKLYWSKTNETKNANLILTLRSKLLILIIDYAESCFFFPSLAHFFFVAT